MHRAEALAAAVLEARERTFELVADLTDQQFRVPRMHCVNPLVWELGHVAWFQEYWVLRQGAGDPPLRPDADRLFDSGAVPHGVRWDLDLPTRAEAEAYLREVRDRVARRLEGPVPDRLRHLVEWSVHHEDMHAEALTYTRQTLGYRAPRFGHLADPVRPAPGPLPPGDADVPGGRLRLGAEPGAGWAFDNEKWAHEVEVAPFRIARTAVTEGEFRAFVDADGYARRELWTEAGWAWRTAEGARAPIYWRREDDTWRVRRFDAFEPLDEFRAMAHVNRHEAEAWCRFAGRRLPTEAEWELAAAGEPKRVHPWGEGPAGADRANLDWRGGGAADVRALPGGDGPFGCRQLAGNVWEWTATDFAPYPGFVPDMYEDFSRAAFGTTAVLRGGCWATRSRMVRNTLRNFFPPSRRDIFAGFRTCAL